MTEYDGMLALDRLERAVEKVRDRLLRSTAALEAAGVPYAVIGGNAVMAWVEQVDETAVRFTRNRADRQDPAGSGIGGSHAASNAAAMSSLSTSGSAMASSTMSCGLWLIGSTLNR
jgi:hypothetical protein